MTALFFHQELERLRFDDRNHAARRDLRVQRVFRDGNQAWELDDLCFKRNFRLTREMVLGFCRTLTDPLEGVRTTSLPVDLKVLIALRFYARGSYRLDVGQNIFLGVSQSSVSRCIRDVTKAINGALVHKYIKFSETEVQKTAIKMRFQEECNFPGTIGAIDCTHVAIVPPPNNNPDFPEYIFVNRKSYHSLNVQLVCEYDLLILSANTNIPGSCHDSHIYRSTAVSAHLQESYLNGSLNDSWLTGDSGNPLSPWLMVPIIGNEELTSEFHFMEAFCKARFAIERCNGWLKQRFRCLLKASSLHYLPEVSSQIVMAFYIFHNMCMMNGLGEEVERKDDDAPFVADDHPIPTSSLLVMGITTTLVRGSNREKKGPFFGH